MVFDSEVGTYASVFHARFAPRDEMLTPNRACVAGLGGTREV